MANERPSKVDSIIGALAHLGIEAKIKEYNIKKAWAAAVGDSISRRAAPVRLIGKTLHCAVSSSPWMTELSYQKAAIIKKLNELLGKETIAEIIFKLGPVSEARAPSGEKIKKRKISGEEKLFIEEATKGVKDEELKSLIKRVIEKSKTGI